eukprot:6207123-Pleurochrysis_carterae.AAC.1
MVAVEEALGGLGEARSAEGLKVVLLVATDSSRRSDDMTSILISVAQCLPDDQSESSGCF